MTDETEVFWSPGDVAKHLGVSPSGLRRLAGVYAQVHGDLSKDSSGTSRRWPSEAVSRLEQARALMAAGQARSIKDALLAVESGATPSADVALALGQELGQEGRVVEALGVVAARPEALYDSSRRLHLEVEALRGELRARDQGSLPAAPKAYGGAQAAGKGEQAVTADKGIGDQLERTEANGLVVRVAKWLERIVRGGNDRS